MIKQQIKTSIKKTTQNKIQKKRQKKLSLFLVKMPKKYTTIDTKNLKEYNTINKFGGNMKKFLLYIVIAIAVVSLGLTIYYFSTDNEAIYIKSSYMVINKGDLISTSNINNQLLDFKNKSEYTTLNYVSENEEVLSYNANEYYFVGNIGGESKIVITTSNRNYSRFIVDVLVCDGSEEYPYIIRTEEELNNIKKNEETLNYNYKLGNDIELTQPWSPIPSYGKVFDGNYFAIKNMTITDESLNSSNNNNVNTAQSSSPITNAGFVSILEKTGVIKNLFLEDLNIDCSIEFVGSFAGTSKGVIQTSEATGKIKNNTTNGTSYVGGVAGQILSESDFKTKIDRCGFEGEIESSGSTQTIGGVAGQNQGGNISETYSRTFVKNGQNNFGGIVGLNQGTSNFTADIYDSYFYLTNTSSQINFSNMRGIIYSNTNSSQENNITGNYYGGKLSSSEVLLKPIGDNFKSSTNGYLTSILSSNDNVEFEDKTKFVTVKYSNGEDNRLWNFNSVWDIPNNSNYPILNVYSSVGSVYLIDVSSITTNNHISTAQQLYDVLNDPDTTETYMIANDISLDANSSQSFIWGDSSSNHSLPVSFKGTIINGTTIDETTGKTRPCEIKNITIKNEQANSNVGLVKSLASSAKMVGLVIKNVTITGESNAAYVGVLAGVSFGAHIYNVKVEQVTVNLSGVGFGTICGYASDYESQGIDNVSVKYVEATNSYYVYAGGIVGVNLGTITTENSNYNTVYAINLVANYVGGVAGANGGKIYYSNAKDINFNVEQNSNTIQNIYSGNYHVFVGGIAGINEATLSTGLKYKGVISDVYANLSCYAQTGNGYNIYIGGVSGYNGNTISRAYVNSLDVNVTGSQSVFVGGVVGYNTGRISNSVVDKNSKIITSIVASIGASKNYVLNTNNCSIVGGIVGYDGQTSNSTYSIYQCASLINKIQGYYAGGISGISFGKVENSYCGESTEDNGGVTILGHMTGGISAVIAGGFVKNCYTFCQLSSGSYNGGSYKDVTSALNMDVRCMGGIAVFVFNSSTQVSSCYTVVSFSGNGVSYGSCADGYNGGKVLNCAYATVGYVKTSIGTQITKSNLQGADGYRAFKQAIGTTTVWNLSDYPTLEGVNVRLPNSNLPNV